MTLDRTVRQILWVLIALGTVAGLVAAGRRYGVEQRNRSVEFVVDLAEVRTLAAAARAPLRGVLARFRAAGVTSVAVPEDTFLTLETEGKVQAQRDGAATTVAIYSSDLLERVAASLADRGYTTTWDTLDEETEPDALTNFALRMELKEGGGTHRSRYRFFVPVDYAVLRNLGVGIDPELVREVKAAGLLPVGRITNFPGASPDAMRRALVAAGKLGVRTVVFQGLDVFGYRGRSKEAAEAFRVAKVRFGQIEFGKQRGDEALGRALDGDLIRVHSISDGEIGITDTPEAIDRFERAARERNIRLCYVRMITFAGTDPVADNLEYIRQIVHGTVRGSEMVAREARVFDDPGVSPFLYALIAIGVAAGAALLIVQAMPSAGAGAAVAFAVMAVLCVLAATAGGETGRRLVALLAAVVYPTIACLHRTILDHGDTSTGWRAAAVREKGAAAGAASKAALGALASASAVTMLGVVSVVGLLASRPFMMRVNQFLGIKLAHAAPILIIAVIAVTGLPRAGRLWAEERERIRRRVSDFLAQPMGVGMLVLAAVAIAALALALARTGNEPGVGVSGLELKLRSILDNVLPVRPRTKEFLIGHPAFVLAFALWFRGKRRWVAPLLLIGVVGQVSLLNTFCHIHTPLRLSVIRALTGLVVGGAIGVALFRVVDALTGSGPHDHEGRAAAGGMQSHQ